MKAVFSGKLRRVALPLALGVLLFFLYAFLPLSAPGASASPDENVNLFFSTLVARKSELHVADPLNVATGGIVHPRSTAIVDDLIVPGGFLGLPMLYGIVAKAVGTAALPYFTPIVAVFAVIAWGLLLSRIFDERTGVLGAAFLAFNPAWWYWTSRSLMPNVLFTSLAIGGTWLLVAAPVANWIERKQVEGVHLLRRTDGALAGILFGMALAVRPVEAYWMGLAALIALLLVRKRPWQRLIIAAVFAAMTFAPFLMLNVSIYGHPFSTGYGDVAASAVTAAAQGGMGARLLGPLRPYLFPLGFAPRTALSTFWTYGAAFFWWWTALFAAAVIFLLYVRKISPSSSTPSSGARAFFVASAVIAVWLVLFYGGWKVQDNPDPNAVTIGSSYLRYWLPMFVVSTAPVALALSRASRRTRARWLLPVVVAVFAFVSGWAVFTSPQEGLHALRGTLLRQSELRDTIVSMTPKNAVIVVDRADKFLFPARQVVVPLRNDRTYAALPTIAKDAPLYYFGITLPKKDLDWLNGTKLPPLGLSVSLVRSMGEQSLYSFSKLPTKH